MIAESRVVPPSDYCETLFDFHSPLPCPRHDNTIARQQTIIIVIAVIVVGSSCIAAVVRVTIGITLVFNTHAIIMHRVQIPHRSL